MSEVPDERYDIDMTEKSSNGKLEEYVCRILSITLLNMYY